MKATDLLAELRPPLDTTPGDETTLERILLAGPAPSPTRTHRHRRPLVAVGVAALVATGAVALAPSPDAGPVGLARAAADLAQPDVLLHFRATTTYGPGSTSSTETWQTPDGRAWHEIRDDGSESTYDQVGGTFQTYVRERDEVLVSTRRNFPETFEDRPNPFGTITDGSHSQVGDLPALLRLALAGTDPDVRHVGRTTVRGIDVDHVQVRHREQVADAPALDMPRPHGSSKAWRAALKARPAAGTRTITIVHDVYVRHDDALPVRVVQRPGYDRGTVTDFDDVQKLALDATTRSLLKLRDHRGAEPTIQPPFDDSRADGD